MSWYSEAINTKISDTVRFSQFKTEMAWSTRINTHSETPRRGSPKVYKGNDFMKFADRIQKYIRNAKEKTILLRGPLSDVELLRIFQYYEKGLNVNRLHQFLKEP